MLDINACLHLIDAELNSIYKEDRKPVELYEPVRYILQLGGKRIRPLITILSCNLFSDRVEHALKPAIALEVFHNFTLVHDDIMDNAPLRRNKPTVHEKWDKNLAILSGDVMQILAYRLMSTNDVHLLPSLLEVFNTTATEVCEGQQFDMNFSTIANVELIDYLRMIELKTAVLIAASFKIGSLCGGAPHDQANLMYEFGRNLGLAFQIQDDYLDTYGDSASFGKTIRGDIAENKKTYLLIQALKSATGENAAILRSAIQNEIKDPVEKINWVKKVYNALEIPSLTLQAFNFIQIKHLNFSIVYKFPENEKRNSFN